MDRSTELESPWPEDDDELTAEIASMAVLSNPEMSFSIYQVLKSNKNTLELTHRTLILTTKNQRMRKEKTKIFRRYCRYEGIEAKIGARD